MQKRFVKLSIMSGGFTLLISLLVGNLAQAQIYLKNVVTGTCLSSVNGEFGSAACDNIHRSTSTWNFIELSTGNFLIQNSATGMCISSSPTLRQTYCDANHRAITTWKSVATSVANQFRLVSTASNYCLAQYEDKMVVTWCDGVHLSSEAWTTMDAPAVVTKTGAVRTPVIDKGFNFGVFSGGGKYAYLVNNYEAWLGRKVDYNVEFISYTGYTTTSDNLVGSLNYGLGEWTALKKTNHNMMFSVPLSTNQDTSLAHVAAGMYDSEFQAAATKIAADYPNAIIRIGWEFNGNWYPWAAKGREADYIAAFRHVSTLFKKTSKTFTIDWCPGIGTLYTAADKSYPGDDVVDIIGLDAYLNETYYTSLTNSASKFYVFANQAYGLSWQKTFAAAHGKPMSLPEWGINTDDSYIIQAMYKWISANNFAYASYWDSNSSFASSMSNGQYPAAADLFKKLFSVTLN